MKTANLSIRPANNHPGPANKGRFRLTCRANPLRRGPTITAGVNDPELDRLIEAQQQDFDLENRKALARQIRERELDQVYRLWIAMYYFAEFTKPYVRNWVTHELYMFQHGWGAHSMEYTWLER